jgi:hypothetical protein
VIGIGHGQRRCELLLPCREGRGQQQGRAVGKGRQGGAADRKAFEDFARGQWQPRVPSALRSMSGMALR